MALQRVISGEPLVQVPRLDALTDDGALMTIEHRGSADQLAMALREHGAELTQAQGGLLIRSAPSGLGTPELGPDAAGPGGAEQTGGAPTGGERIGGQPIVVAPSGVGQDELGQPGVQEPPLGPPVGAPGQPTPTPSVSPAPGKPTTGQ